MHDMIGYLSYVRCNAPAGYLNLHQSQLPKQLIRPIIKLWQPGSIIGITLRDADDHALAGASKEDAVGVELVGAAFGDVDVLPTVGAEVEVLPAVAVGIVAEVAIPDKAGPVEFQALDIEFCGDVFQEEGRTNVRDRVQEPGNNIGLRTDINGKGLKAEGLGGDEHSVAFRATRVLTEPGFGLC